MSEYSDYLLALKLQQEIDKEFVSNPEKTDDFLLAVELQERETHLNDVIICESSKPSNGKTEKNNLANQSWELIDPTPDTRGLFVEFDKKYFWGKLASVEVSWSRRMTMCAGICSYAGQKSGYCSIKLSEPLLKLRPRKNLLETLLHEMIHAYLFVTKNNRDRDGHGPEFKSHMHRINTETGLHITVYHDFHDEVALYKTHWWKCNGPCQHRHPFYGMVKRSMNRAPSHNDTWWSQHQSQCGGVFTKVHEPSGYVKKGGVAGKEVGSSGVGGSGVGGMVGGGGKIGGGSGMVGGGGKIGGGSIKIGGSNGNIRSFMDGGGNGSGSSGGGGSVSSIGGTIWGFGDKGPGVSSGSSKESGSNFHGVGGSIRGKLTSVSNDLTGRNGKQLNSNTINNTMDTFLSKVVDEKSTATNSSNNNNESNATTNINNSNDSGNPYSNVNDILKSLHSESMERLKRKRSENEDDNNKDRDLYGNVKKKVNNRLSDNESVDGVDIVTINVTEDKENQYDASDSCNNTLTNANISSNNNNISIKAEQNNDENCIHLNHSTNNKLSKHKKKSSRNISNNYDHSLTTVKNYKVTSKGGIEWGRLNHGTVVEKSPKNEKDLKQILSDASLKTGSVVKINGFTSVSSGAKLKPDKKSYKKKRLSEDLISPIKNVSTKKDTLNSSSSSSKSSASYSGSIESYMANVTLDKILSSLKSDIKPSSASSSLPSLPSSSLSASSLPRSNLSPPPTSPPSPLQATSTDVNCPICDLKLPVNLINKHLDDLH